MSPHRPTLIAILLAAAVTLGACGGDDDDEASGDREGQPAAEAPTEATQEASEVSMSEFKFDPAGVTAAAGSTITVKNIGSVGHDLKLREGGEVIGGTEVLGGGKSEQLPVDFPAGEYEMFCSVPGHEDSGMKGSFTVD